MLYTVWIVYVTLDTGNSFELGVFTVLYTVWIVYVTLDTGHSFELGVFTVLYTVQRVRFKACLLYTDTTHLWELSTNATRFLREQRPFAQHLVRSPRAPMRC